MKSREEIGGDEIAYVAWQSVVDEHYVRVKLLSSSW
jgi:hypothetical protein